MPSSTIHTGKEMIFAQLVSLPVPAFINWSSAQTTLLVLMEKKKKDFDPEENNMVGWVLLTSTIYFCHQLEQAFVTGTGRAETSQLPTNCFVVSCSH